MSNMTILIITMISIAVLAISFYFCKTHRDRLVSLLVIISSLSAYLWFKQPYPQKQAQQNKTITHAEAMLSLQEQLADDPNQAALWFQLGQGYMMENDFKSAFTCFDYVIKLIETPTASQWAAKATAVYYLNKQSLNDDVRYLLKQAIELEPENETALTLIANDHFISSRYQEAVETWEQLLNSSNTKLDRQGIIHAMNNAKMLVKKR